MVDINMYGVYTSLKEVRDELKRMRAQWFAKYPSKLTDVDFTRPNEAFFKTRDLKNQMRGLDILLNDIRTTSATIYDISANLEELMVQCKTSKLTTLSHISTIESADGDIKAAIARQDQKDMEERERNKFVEGRGKRKAHRR